MSSRLAASPAPIDLSEAGRNLATGLATRLRNDIVAGVLPPGTKLSIDELRADHCVSLSPMREALAHLAAEGFVVLHDKKGFRVAPVSRANCREVAQLQILLESQALGESIRRGDEHWEENVVAASRSLSRLEHDGFKDGAAIDEWERQHRHFHGALIAACEMPLLLSMCMSLHDFSARYRRLFLALHVLDPVAPDEHRDILDAALRREPKDATWLMANHIQRTADNILATLDERAR